MAKCGSERGHADRLGRPHRRRPRARHTTRRLHPHDHFRCRRHALLQRDLYIASLHLAGERGRSQLFGGLRVHGAPGLRAGAAHPRFRAFAHSGRRLDHVQCLRLCQDPRRRGAIHYPLQTVFPEQRAGGAA